MSTAPNILQIQGPVVVLPPEEYLEQKAQLEKYQRLQSIYTLEREERFRRLMAIAERNRDIPYEQVEEDIYAAVEAVRG